MLIIQTSGLPHSDTRGSWDIGSSPRLFAANHVLLRLAAPRHPPWTLISLDHIVLSIPSLSAPAFLPRRHVKNLLEARGFEPLTLGLQSRCSSQLSHAPSCSNLKKSAERRSIFSSIRAVFCLQDLHLLDNVLVLAPVVSPERPFLLERR